MTGIGDSGNRAATSASGHSRSMAQQQRIMALPGRMPACRKSSHTGPQIAYASCSPHSLYFWISQAVYRTFIQGYIRAPSQCYPVHIKITSGDHVTTDPILLPRRRPCRHRRLAYPHRAAAPARRPALHRHQGRLRRGRLRRLHRRHRRAARTAQLSAEGRQFLHPVPAHARRQGAVHGRRPAAAGRRAAPGAAGDGRMPRLAMRLLHAGLRDVAVGHVPEAGRRKQPRRAARSTTRCPATCAAAPATVPSSRPRSAHDRTAARSHSTAPRWPTQLRALAARRRRRVYACDGQPLPRAAHAGRTGRAARRASRRRRCWPAPPTSACGSPSSCASWATSSTSARSPSCKTGARSGRHAGDRRRRHAGRRLRGRLPPLPAN